MTAKITKTARKLRNDPTEAEKKLWLHLRGDNIGVRFRRQMPIGPYIADFACPAHKLIVEIDGGQHDENSGRDAVRTKFLESCGFRVLRFWNNDVLKNTEAVIDMIKKAANTPPHTPPHAGGQDVGYPVHAGERNAANAGGSSPLTSPPYTGGIEGGRVPAKSGLDRIRVVGGQRLNGTIRVSGAKNAALPLFCAALLTDEPVQFLNAPVTLNDIGTLSEVLSSLGAVVSLNQNGTATIHTKTIISDTAPYELVSKMRASVLVLGPLLARHGKAAVSLPGGCAIGTRPVDLHIDGLKAMGAEIEIEGGYIKASAPQGLKGAKIDFPKVSVGATENLMMAATLASGETVLNNAAQEPEIVDLGECLIAMGAKIEGLGTPRIVINGVKKLHGCTHRVVADRIETGTWMIAACLTGGTLRLQNARLEHLTALIKPLEDAGLNILEDNDDIVVSRGNRPLAGTDIMTEPYPGFPTDLQAQFMTMLTLCMGAGMVTETIFENRFMHVPELARMGADIRIQGNSAIIRGVPKLKGAEVMATDLRASVALVLAALVAEGETFINRIYHLDRGYENIVEKLGACGARIERLSPSE